MTSTTIRRFSRALLLLLSISFAALGWAAVPEFDLVIQGGRIFDGTGGPSYLGDVGIRGARIVYVGPPRPMRAKQVIDAHGQAISPGFINMLSQAQESIFVDGREESDLFQGVTLEVMGEGDSMGPLTDSMAARNESSSPTSNIPLIGARSGSIYKSESGQALAQHCIVCRRDDRSRFRARRGRLAAFAATAARMRGLVRQAMEQGALGVSSALIYTPATFAKTDELAALATESGCVVDLHYPYAKRGRPLSRGGGRDYLDRATERRAGRNLSPEGRRKIQLAQAGEAIAKIEAARKSGVRITADMYAYTAGGTGLDAAMPPWVREGGLERGLNE